MQQIVWSWGKVNVELNIVKVADKAERKIRDALCDSFLGDEGDTDKGPSHLGIDVE